MESDHESIIEESEEEEEEDDFVTPPPKPTYLDMEGETLIEDDLEPAGVVAVVFIHDACADVQRRAGDRVRQVHRPFIANFRSVDGD